MRALRPYVSFNYDLRKKLSPAEKAKITRYFNQLRAADNDNTEIYRPRKAANREIAKKYADVSGSEWKNVPIKKSVEGSKVSIRNGRITFDTILGVATTYLLNQDTLAIDAREALDEAGVPKTIEKRQRYAIVTGGNDYNSLFNDYEDMVDALELDFEGYKSSEGFDFRLDIQIITFPNPTKEARARYAASTKKQQRAKQQRKRKRKM